MTALTALLPILLAYLLGSVPFAVIVSRLMGLRDPRRYGSGNPGATNVLRSGNKKAALLTLVGDAAKGWLAVYLAAWLTQAWGLPGWTVAGAALAAFLGHLYPIFLRLRGGKGVATALGILIAVSPWLGLATAATWLLVAYVSRYSSLAAVLAAIASPIYYLLGAGSAWRMDAAMLTALLAISALLLYRHRGNIDRLLRGKESRIGQK